MGWDFLEDLAEKLATFKIDNPNLLWSNQLFPSELTTTWTNQNQISIAPVIHAIPQLVIFYSSSEISCDFVILYIELHNWKQIETQWPKSRNI